MCLAPQPDLDAGLQPGRPGDRRGPPPGDQTTDREASNAEVTSTSKTLRHSRLNNAGSTAIGSPTALAPSISARGRAKA